MKIPARATNTNRDRQKKRGFQMSLSNFIRNVTKSQYFRRLVVRAIEDACILLMLGVTIWAICWVVGGIFRILGVA
jgi:hypothetical protein